MSYSLRRIILGLVIVQAAWGGSQLSSQNMEGVPLDQLPTIEGYPHCISNAQSGYKDKACLIQIDRSAPIVPPASIVPVGTTVYIELINTRWNENVTFTLTTTHSTTQDVITAGLKNALPALQTIQIQNGTVSIQAPPGAPFDNIETFRKTIVAQQVALTVSLNQAVSSIQAANAAMGCLSSYEVIQPNKFCSQAAMLTPQTFNEAKQAAIDLSNKAAAASVPVLDISDLDTVSKSFYLTCVTFASGFSQGIKDSAARVCRAYGEQIAVNETLLDSSLSDIQKSQDALIQNVLTLQGWPGAPAKIAYKFVTTKNNNLSVVIAGVEIVNKVASPNIATIAINPQANRWVVSSGIAASNLTYHTYVNAPIIVNGVPVVSSSGQTETIVTRLSTSPSFIAPEALISYNLIPHNWTSSLMKCPNNCTFLLTGGVGANLTSKTADFDAGLSFQIGGALFTPAVHFGRDSRLTDGLKVGDKLGTSPPNPLPTENVWVRKFGFAITYTIPTP